MVLIDGQTSRGNRTVDLFLFQTMMFITDCASLSLSVIFVCFQPTEGNYYYEYPYYDDVEGKPYESTSETETVTTKLEVLDRQPSARKSWTSFLNTICVIQKGSGDLVMIRFGPNRW